MTTLMKIGEVARLAGVSVDTIRYYERLGLVEPAARAASGYRQYTAEAVARLGAIGRAKGLGFSLEAIGELLRLGEGRGSCGDVQRRAQAKLREIDDQLNRLGELRARLASLTAQCSPSKSLDACPGPARVEHARPAVRPAAGDHLHPRAGADLLAGKQPLP